MLFYEGLAYDDLADWAGEGSVSRADYWTVAAWRISEADKTALVDIGIPNGGSVTITQVCCPLTGAGRCAPGSPNRTGSPSSD